MADSIRDTTDNVRQRRNARRRGLYRIHRAAETTEQSEERRRRTANTCEGDE